LATITNSGRLSHSYMKNLTMKKAFIAVILTMWFMSAYAYAATASLNNQKTATGSLVDPNLSNAVEERAAKEEKIPANFFTIDFHKPNYVIPYYYTGSPYNSVYVNETPQNEKLTRDEIKYQLSFKVPLWKNILKHQSTLFLAYTQLSYWQAYNKAAFFRETDFNPELFVANELNYAAYKNFIINFINIGAEHQSNGFGNTLERSWNRIYLEGITSIGNLMIAVKPWIILHDSSYQTHNPDMSNYLGYMQVMAAYKYNKNVYSFRTYGLVIHGGRRASAEVSWSFPITAYINGYLQGFSGYGQSLIEYNHRTNSAGIGIALSNWI
jgi:phospholipase A1